MEGELNAMEDTNTNGIKLDFSKLNQNEKAPAGYNGCPTEGNPPSTSNNMPHTDNSVSTSASADKPKLTDEEMWAEVDKRPPEEKKSIVQAFLTFEKLAGQKREDMEPRAKRMCEVWHIEPEFAKKVLDIVYNPSMPVAQSVKPQPAKLNKRTLLENQQCILKLLQEEKGQGRTLATIDQPAVIKVAAELEIEPEFVERALAHTFTAEDPELTQLANKPDGRSATSASNGGMGGRPTQVHGNGLWQLFSTALAARGEYLVQWRDDWYIYREGMYKCIEYGELEAMVVEFVQPMGLQATSELISKMLLNGKPSYFLPERFPKPCWIDTKTPALGWTLFSNGKYGNTLNYAKSLNGVAMAPADIAMPATHKLFSTAAVGYAFDPSAKAPRFEKYLEEVQPDPQVRDSLLMIMGLCLIDCTDYNVFFVLTGQGGCGKSVYAHLLRLLVGGEEQVSCVPLTTFSERFATRQLTLKRLNCDTDMPESEYGKSSGCEGILKKVTDGEAIDAEEKMKARRSAPATARCVFACNDMPYLRDKSSALWDRMRIIPFNVRFRDTARENRRLRYELEDELPGIYNLAVQALARLLKLKMFPETIDGVLKKNRERIGSDAFLQWFNEKIVVTGLDKDRLGKADLFVCYTQWCSNNGVKRGVMTSYHLAERMLDQKIRESVAKVDGTAKRCWLGVRYRDPEG